MTTTEIDSLITLLKTSYQAAITTPKPDYQVGEIKVNWAQYTQALLNQITQLEKMKNDVGEVIEEETTMIG